MCLHCLYLKGIVQAGVIPIGGYFIHFRAHSHKLLNDEQNWSKQWARIGRIFVLLASSLASTRPQVLLGKQTYLFPPQVSAMNNNYSQWHHFPIWMAAVSYWHLSPKRVMCNIPLWLPDWTLFQGGTKCELKVQILGLTSNPGSATAHFKIFYMLYISVCFSFLIAKWGTFCGGWCYHKKLW